MLLCCNSRCCNRWGRRRQHFQQGRRFAIGRAVKQCVAVFHLEGDQHIARRFIEDARIRRRIAVLGQLFLEPDGVRHLLLKNKALRGHTVRVRPDDQARIGQLAPWEQGARILLALRGDLVMAQDVFRRDVVAGLDIFQQRNQLIDLCLRKRIPEAAFRRVLVAGVDDLDARGGLPACPCSRG